MKAIVSTGCVAITLLALPVAGQDAKEAEHKPASFRPMIEAHEVRPHVEYLASPELRGRSGRDAVMAAEYLQAHFERLELLPLFEENSFFQQIPGPPLEDGTPTRYGQNVGAWLPGCDPKLRDEFIIVSAHYDHLGVRNGEIHPGADDNASGTSMLLEVAEEFASLKPRPKRSIAFVGFDLEERLLWGSRWFAAHPPWPIDQIKLFTTADMIGRSLGDLPLKTVFVLGSEHGRGLDATLDEIGDPEGFMTARMGIDLIGTRSDYGPFRDRKVPFLFFSTGEHPDYHKPTDVPERIDYEQVAAVSSLIFRVTQTVADAETTPAWESEIQPQLSEVRSVHRIATTLLETGDGKLNNFQKFIVNQAEVTTRQILERDRVTPDERVALIRIAQILLLSVF